jgi:hypothetical protein
VQKSPILSPTFRGKKYFRNHNDRLITISGDFFGEKVGGAFFSKANVMVTFSSLLSGANSTTVSYNAVSSLTRFENKNIFFYVEKTL